LLALTSLLVSRACSWKSAMRALVEMLHMTQLIVLAGTHALNCVP